MRRGFTGINKTHADDVVKAALEIQKFMVEHLQQRKKMKAKFLKYFMSAFTGPVVAGIVGAKKFAYDIWGIQLILLPEWSQVARSEK